MMSGHQRDDEEVKTWALVFECLDRSHGSSGHQSQHRLGLILRFELFVSAEDQVVPCQDSRRGVRFCPVDSQGGARTDPHSSSEGQPNPGRA